MFAVQRLHHGLFVNAQEFAVRHGCGRPHAQRLPGQAAFSEKLSLAQYAESSFPADLGYNRESNLALLDVKDRVSRISLREDRLVLGKGHDFPASTDGGKEFLRVEIELFFG
jgi:hypothetical protein